MRRFFNVAGLKLLLLANNINFNRFSWVLALEETQKNTQTLLAQPSKAALRKNHKYHQSMPHWSSEAIQR